MEYFRRFRFSISLFFNSTRVGKYTSVKKISDKIQQRTNPVRAQQRGRSEIQIIRSQPQIAMKGKVSA